MRGDEEPEQLWRVGGALLGDGGGDRAEGCIAFAFEENGAEGACSCCDAGGANDRRGGGAEGSLGIGIEPNGVGEAEFGGEGREGGVGAGGG